MQVHSVISNTISEEILGTGHLSIRFMADGFSLLLEDREYRPVILNKFTEASAISLTSHVLSCSQWLDRNDILDGFRGEVSIVVDSLSTAVVPEELFSKKDAHLYLQHEKQIKVNETIKYKSIRKRPFGLVYAVPASILELSEKFSGKVRIMPPAEIMLSMADQVNAADHQRGFALAEYQTGFMGILIIRNDELVLTNNFELKNEEGIVYHTLNALQQLEFDRHNSPLYHSGLEFKNELVTLGRYIRKVLSLPYQIIDMEKTAIQEHILLAEATRCE